MWFRMVPPRSAPGAGLVKFFCLVAFALVVCAGEASAQDNSEYTFAALYPDFLKTQLIPAYVQFKSATSPAAYVHGDYRARFRQQAADQ